MSGHPPPALGQIGMLLIGATSFSRFLGFPQVRSNDVPLNLHVHYASLLTNMHQCWVGQRLRLDVVFPDAEFGKWVGVHRSRLWRLVFVFSRRVRGFVI